MAGRFSVEAVFKAIDRVTAPVTKMQNRIGKFTRSASRGFHRLNRSVKKFGAGLKRASVVGVAALGIFAAASTAVLGAGADFEQAIVNVGAVSLQTRDQIAPLEKLALKLGKTTKFTATQSANAMEIMSRAGFKTNEILSATPAVLSAAAASGLEIAEVANVVSNALKGMGLEATQAGRVADILALASSRTNSSIGSLGESLKNVASTARQLNVPIEDTVAAIALLQDVGLDASVAGSAFNVMLTKMAAPTVGMQKKMKRLGVSFKDAKGNMLPLQDVLGQLNKASAKVGGNFDKVAFLAELVGLRGQKAAANLGELFKKGKLDQLTKELQNAAGAAKKMADIRMSTVQGSMLLLGSAVDAVKVKIFGLQNGPLKKLIDSMTTWVGKNEDVIASNIGEFLGMIINNLGTIVEWVKNIGKGLVVFFALAGVLKILIGILTLVNLVMAANPITLMVIGVIALAVALASVSKPFRNLLTTLGSFTLDVLIGALTIVSNIFMGIFGFVAAIVKGLGQFTGITNLLGLGDDEETPTKAKSGVISPQERLARNIDEQRTTTTSEVTLKAEQGTRAEVTGGRLGMGLTLEPSGGA